MSSEWSLTKLSTLGVFDRGKSKHRPRDAAHLYGGPYPFIQTGDITASGGRITSYRQTYSEAGLAQSKLWPQGTLCITIAANIAETALLTFPACFPDSVVGFIPYGDKSDVRYIEYIFRAFRENVKSRAYGSVQENINLEVLRNLAFPIPDLKTQIVIADYLSLFDDRIALLRETNATLEAIAQALFKSWFVDFDPVRAKAEGRQPEGIDAETAALFPGSFEESELGLIPKGWKVGALNDICQKVESGGTPKRARDEYWNGTIGWLTSGEVRSAIVYETKEKITQLGVKESSAKVWPTGTTIVAMYGATAGVVCLLAKAVTANQACCGLIPLKETRTYLFLITRRESQTLASKSSGSAQQNLNKRLISSHKIIMAPIVLCNAFEEIVGHFLDSWILNDMRAKTLAALRDTLLPRLISGQLRLPEVSTLMEGTPK
jgi:type I restriction enzyme, S subunit